MDFDFEEYLKKITYEEFLDAVSDRDIYFGNLVEFYEAEYEEFIAYLYDARERDRNRLENGNTTAARWNVMLTAFQEKRGLSWAQERLKEKSLRQIYPRNVYEIVVYYSLCYNDREPGQIGLTELRTIYEALADTLDRLAEDVTRREDREFFLSRDVTGGNIITVRDLKDYLDAADARETKEPLPLVTGVITQQLADRIGGDMEQITGTDGLIDRIKASLEEYAGRLSVCSDRCRWYLIKYLYIYMMYQFEKYVRRIKEYSRKTIAGIHGEIEQEWKEKELQGVPDVEEMDAKRLLKEANDFLCLNGSPARLDFVNPLYFKKQNDKVSCSGEGGYTANIGICAVRREGGAFYGKIDILCKKGKESLSGETVFLHSTLKSPIPVSLNDKGFGSVETVIASKEDGSFVPASFCVAFAPGVLSDDVQFDLSARFSNITGHSAIFQNDVRSEESSDHAALLSAIDELSAEELMDYPVQFSGLLANLFLEKLGGAHGQEKEQEKNSRLNADKSKFIKILHGEIDINRETLLFFLLSLYLEIDFENDTDILERYLAPEDYLDVERVNTILSRCGFAALDAVGEELNPLDVILTFALMDRENYFEIISDLLSEFSEETGEHLLQYSFGKSRSSLNDEKKIVRKIRGQ